MSNVTTGQCEKYRREGGFWSGNRLVTVFLVMFTFVVTVGVIALDNRSAAANTKETIKEHKQDARAQRTEINARLGRIEEKLDEALRKSAGSQ